MSDLGTEAGASALKLANKSWEILFKLIGKLFDAWLKAPERKEHKLRALQAQREEDKFNALTELSGMTGYVNHELLVKSGQELSLCGIYLTEEEINDLSEICEREMITFSAVTNQKYKEAGEKAFYAIECKAADLERFRGAIDRFNDEKRQKFLDEKIKILLDKKELTPQEYADLNALTDEKERIQKGYGDRFNAEMKDNVIRNSFDTSKLKQMNISEALNRITGRYIDKDQHSIIADAVDPSKVIKCHGYQAKDPVTGKEYIKTDYEVYHGKECVFKTTDGRFEGRPAGYWNQQKEKLEKAADFSGTYYKFHNENDYNRWTEHVNRQNIEELSEMEKPFDIKNYEKCIEIGTEKLNENGVEVKDNILYDKESGKPLELIVKDDSIGEEKRTLAAESIVIGKQIENYENIQELTKEVSRAKAELVIEKPGSEEYAAAKVKVENIEAKLENAYELDKKLIDERKSINATQSMHETEKEVQKKEKTQDGKAQNEQTQDEKEADAKEEKQTTIEKAREDIQKEKAGDGNKGNGSIDKESHEKVSSKSEHTVSSR